MAKISGSSEYSRRMMSLTMLSVVVFLYMLVSLIISYAILMQLFQENKRYLNNSNSLSQQLSQLEAERDRLDSTIKKIGTDAFVVEIARQELGMVSSDEIVFVDNSME